LIAAHLSMLLRAVHAEFASRSEWCRRQAALDRWSVR
jgi:hypothetical protein